MGVCTDLARDSLFASVLKNMERIVKTNKQMTFGFSLGLALAFGIPGLAACGTQQMLEADVDDHAEDGVTFEAASVTSALDANGVSRIFRVPGGFARLGVMWDAQDAAALELRTSQDGEHFTEWSAPQLVSTEEGAHAGMFDGRAAFYQYRVLRDKQPPSFIALEPMRSAPPTGGAEKPSDDGLAARVQGVTTIDTPIGKLDVYSKSDWGGRNPSCSSATNTYRATIHHTVTPTNDTISPQARLRQIQNYHMDVQGWCDIGYNYLVSRDGRIWRGRGVGVLGSHVADNNSGNVGVSFMGTHTSTPATATQLCNAAKLLSVMKSDHGLPLTRSAIKGHRQYGSTECPGDALYNQVDDIVRKAAGGCSTP